MTVSGAISDGGNAYGITKTGQGEVVLTGSNTYTGLTTISQGTLRFESADSTPSTLATRITDNAHLVFDNAGQVTDTARIGGTGDLT